MVPLGYIDENKTYLYNLDLLVLSLGLGRLLDAPRNFSRYMGSVIRYDSFLRKQIIYFDREWMTILQLV